jgi:hypothetical protein
MRPLLLALAFVFACAHETPPAPTPDPTLEWNAALAAVQRRGLTPARADVATGYIETLWVDTQAGRERFVIRLERDTAQVTREALPAGTSAVDAAFAEEIVTLIRARRQP